MPGIFNTVLLKQQPARYVLIAEAVLPAVMIGVGALFLKPSIKAASNVIGRPPGFVFGIVWLVLALIWALALILSSMNAADNFALYGMGIFSFLCLVMCFSWLILYKKMNKELAYFALLGAIVFMAVTTMCTVSSESISNDSKTISSVCFALIGVWLVLAAEFALVELNKP